MKPIQALCATTLVILSTVTAAATAPAAASSHAATTAPAPINAAPRDQQPLALWTYCGMYTRPDGRTGIKCYTV